jgi:hypothetical protein
MCASCAPHEHYGAIIGEVSLRGPDGGWGQAFGQICLDPEHAPAWEREICALFGVDNLNACAQRNCFVLRSWPGFGMIEGLEVDGKRFTLTGFRKRHYPGTEGARGPLAQRKIGLKRSIRRAAAEIERWTLELDTAHENYIDWEEP